MIDIPLETMVIIYAGFASACAALFVLLFLLLNRIRRTIKKARFERVKKISMFQHVLRFFGIILWLATSLTVLFVAAFVQSFQTFNKEELVAEIVCKPVEKDRQIMLLELTPIVDGKPADKSGFLLKGDQWAIEGDVLIWDDWLNFAGLHTMYELTRVRGRFVDVGQERGSQPSVYSLIRHEESPYRRWLYKYGYRLRFVEAVYGNTAYNYPSNEQTFQVFVTTSGFSIKVK